MRRRTVVVLGIVVMLAAAVALVVVLRRNAPPEAARLLPEADAVFYVNVEVLRHTGVFSKMAGAREEPEYQEFIRQTGFQFERDLDEAAFAVHVPPAPPPTSPAIRKPPEAYPRFSEVFIGRFDTDRGSAYFRRLASQTEQYSGAAIFTVPLEGRSVRVALLGPTIAAVSNTETPEEIHAIIDRYRRVALPFSGPSLLADHYRHVPFASVAWLIARIAPAPSAPAENGVSSGGLTSPALLRDVAGGTTAVASLRYLGFLQLRVEAFAANQERAREIAENVSTYLTLFRGAEASLQVSGNDADVKAALASIRVERDSSRAILRAEIPIGLLKKIATEAPAQVTAAPAPTPTPVKPVKPSHNKK